MTFADRVRATFTPREITFDSPDFKPYEVQGITVRELKEQLRGVVFQSQPKFVNQIKSAGFEMTWSVKYNAYIIHG